MRKNIRWLYAVFVIFILSFNRVSADDPAVSFTTINPSFNVTFSNNAGGFNLGYVFQTTQSFDVTQLGVYDDFGNGFLNDHPVALYDISGNLLASTTVTNADPLVGLFRYHPITTLSLDPNTQYVLSAVVGYSPDGNPVDNYTHDPLDLTFDPRIAFVENREASNTQNNLVFPTTVEVSSDPLLQYGWFGPNMLIVSVPEPTTWLLLGTGVIAACCLRRKEKMIKKANL